MGRNRCVPGLLEPGVRHLPKQCGGNLGGLPGGVVLSWGAGESGREGRAVMGSKEHRGPRWDSASLIVSGNCMSLLADLKDRNVFSPSSGGQRSKIKVWAGLVPYMSQE